MPPAIAVEPTYSGWPTNLYGPERVTSRPFSKCPAAQIRTHSPARAIKRPALQVIHVGCASTSVITAAANPRGTRRRASAAADLLITLDLSGGAWLAMSDETSANGVTYF